MPSSCLKAKALMCRSCRATLFTSLAVTSASSGRRSPALRYHCCPTSFLRSRSDVQSGFEWYTDYLLMPNPLSRRLRRRWLPQALALLLVVTEIQAAEQAAAPQATPPPATPASAPPPAAPSPVEQNLKILVLAGSGEMNDLERKVMAPLVV